MSDRTWDRMSGLLVGAAIGFIAGVLMAPSSGPEMRETIRKRTQSSVGQVKEALTDLKDNLAKKGREMLQNGTAEIRITDPDPATPEPDARS
ncbi:MAG: YtxH domain-containing protein [Firmicutes bacterium]|nr:YtxH domain-containing protein [Alicyclobacillaceae bacterium]MCL6497819.1 YtxH domain-containing protein [Bacillota bacterium]